MSDPRIERFNRRLDAHLAHRLREEDAAALKLYRLLERTREELFGKLLVMEDRLAGGQSFTQAYLASVLDDINVVMGRMREEATADARARMLAGLTLGQEQTYAEVAVFFHNVTASMKPRVPTDVMLRLLDGRVGLLDTTFERLRVRISHQLIEAVGATQAQAARLAASTVEEVQARLAMGIAQGEGARSIARRLMAPGDGQFVRLGYREAIMQVRLNLNDAYNDAHAQALVDAQALIPELRQRWASAKVRSTNVCLCLHGAIAPIGGTFTAPGAGGSWNRPPAVGQSATPLFHMCRSRVVPDHPDWPENPKLSPLSAAEREHFASGSGIRAADGHRGTGATGTGRRARTA